MSSVFSQKAITGVDKVGRVAVVTDSGADLPAFFAPDGGLSTAALSVHIDGVEYKDGIDLTRAEFYQKLRAGARKIHTAQPSPGDFVQAYEKVSDADEIICLTLSSRLSGTYQSATMAAELVDADVEVFDSLSASVGLGLMVMRAVEMAEAGASRAEILSEMTRIRDSMQVVFLVDTLEYLERNGRIGKASALVGTVLKIKPLLIVADGLVGPLEKVRGKAKAFRRMMEFVSKRANSPVTAAIAHSDAPQAAAGFEAELSSSSVPISKLVTAEMGPTIGVHAGPGLVGIAFYPTGQ